MGCEVQLAFSVIIYESSKLDNTDLVLVCDQSSSVGLCMQDYKSLLVVVTICAHLVRRHSHRHTGFDRLYY